MKIEEAYLIKEPKQRPEKKKYLLVNIKKNIIKKTKQK